MLIDNKKDRYMGAEGEEHPVIITVWDFLQTYSGKDTGEIGKLDIVTGYFTIRTLSQLYEEMPEETRFRIISSNMVGDDYMKDIIVDLLNDDLDISQIGNLDKHARQAIAFLERENVEMRAEVPDFCHAKAYIFRNNKPIRSNYYVTGSSNLTPAGIGLKKVPNVELNLAENCNGSNAHFVELRKWYDEIWNDARVGILENSEDKKSPKISVKEYFIRKIKEYFRTYSPKEIYYKILFELFNSDIDLENGLEYTKDIGLLQTSVIWKTLFNYQQKGVISLIKMLRKYNGAILADAVGLGKTFSALAVIKYFQLQNYTTVVLCPKKLEQNWTQYQKGVASRFQKDEFEYQVRFHTDCQNNRLQDAYKTYKLDYLQSRKKVLIVIDESHNLRNEKSERYKNLLTTLIQNLDGHEKRDVKVLMLSATPINTGLNDVKGQFNLIGHGNDQAFDNEDFRVESLANIFQNAQGLYTRWCTDPERTIGGFISKLPPNFFNLTDKLIVARTRKLIEKTLGEDLGFPKKGKPNNIYQGVDHFGKFHTTEEIYDAFEKLSLTAYQPSRYWYESNKEARKEAARDWDDDVNREMFLVKMMCLLFMKRLESSWFSCMTTVKKVLDVHQDTLDKVFDYEQNGTDSIIRAGTEVYDEDYDESIIGRRQIKVSDLKNLGGFKKGLQHDINLLNEIYKNLQDFERKYRAKQEKDLKLEELVKILEKKQNSENKKVVVFTAYADTAKFIYDELTARGFSRIASVSGQEVLSTGRHSKKGFAEVLQSFAPYSKLYKELDWDSLYEDSCLDLATYYDEANKRWNVPYELWSTLVEKKCPQYQKLINDGIDILIATDCLSEGQNLQDADLQVNYDIHWNPVRLIQRFGRIDRIGSPNKIISCVNFWPAKSFEDYLHLETRIQNRMAIMNVVGAETQEINENYEQIVKDNPLQDKNADRLLEELQHNSISDIESSQTLSLKDFSFETYRQDLVDYYERNRDFYRRMPNGVFSGFINTSKQFHDLPESLVALVGYPKKPEGKKDFHYSEFYIMCQPIDANEAATLQEINKADVLEILRQNKESGRFMPEWITQNDTERVNRLSDVLKQWMDKKAGKEGRVIINELFSSKKSIKQQPQLTINVDEKYQIENFDLIVWEYVTTSKEL